jgi:UDP-galactopyranose mutase
MAILGPHSIYLCGRFAEWEYYNMDKAIEAAINLVEEIG